MAPWHLSLAKMSCQVLRDLHSYLPNHVRGRTPCSFASDQVLLANWAPPARILARALGLFKHSRSRAALGGQRGRHLGLCLRGLSCLGEPLDWLRWLRLCGRLRHPQRRRLAALGRSLNALPCGLKGSECMPRKRTLREELLIWLQGEELFRRSSPLERILTLSIFGAADGSFPQH